MNYFVYLFPVVLLAAIIGVPYAGGFALFLMGLRLVVHWFFAGKLFAGTYSMPNQSNWGVVQVLVINFVVNAVATYWAYATGYEELAYLTVPLVIIGGFAAMIHIKVNISANMG